MPGMPLDRGFSPKPQSVESKILSAYIQASVYETFSPKAGEPVRDALDYFLDSRLTVGEVTNLRPDADMFFDLRTENPSRFNKAANAYVQENPGSALGAALAGADLNEENRPLAVAQLDQVYRRLLETERL